MRTAASGTIWERRTGRESGGPQLTLLTQSTAPVVPPRAQAGIVSVAYSASLRRPSASGS